MVPVPFHETIIRRLCGRLVYVIMQDGRQYIGKLSSCSKGKIVLNGDLSSMPFTDTSTTSKRASKKKRKTKEKWNKRKLTRAKNTRDVQISTCGAFHSFKPFFPYYYHKRVELNLALVISLFLLFI